MKTLSNKTLFALAITTCVLLSSCTVRLVDFTTISTKNVNLDIDRKQGKKTEGKKTYFLGIGFNLKDAIDIAIENAGNEYDMLVDGVVRYSNYPFVVIVKVEGVAVSTSAMKKSMGSTEFDEWLEEKDGVYNKSNETEAIAK